jgi:hypothetical protein
MAGPRIATYREEGILFSTFSRGMEETVQMHEAPDTRYEGRYYAGN